MIYIDLKGEVIESDSEWIYDWYGIQAVSPARIQKQLNNANKDDIIIRVNSGGGNMFAGCEIYNMLMAYEGNVIFEIQGLCASIASLICMAGTCKMSPVAQMMIHNVSVGGVSGDYRDMEHTADILKKANKTISNAYELKTGMSKEEIKELMDKETWFTAEEALEKGLIDEIMYSDFDENIDINMTNLLKNNAIKMCNSISIESSVVKKFKNLNIIKNQPVKREKVDFFMQQKLKAKLNLMKLKGVVE